MTTNHKPLEPGVVRLVKLQTEGRLRIGDLVATLRLGVCTVTAIHAVNTIDVRAVDGRHYRLTGLSFGAGTRMVESPATQGA